MSNHNEQHDIPPGYWRNAQGNLVPETKVADIDKKRDALVKKLIKQAAAVQATMAAFKSGATGDVHAFVDLSAERYGVKLGGKKGNVSLLSFDGRYKVQYAVSDRQQFDERIQIAKALIDECIQDWTANSSDNIKALIEHAFQVNKEGQLDKGRVLGLTKLEITDPKWKLAMQAITDSIQVTSTANYLRLYERVGDSDKFEQISLDLAGL